MDLLVEENKRVKLMDLSGKGNTRIKFYGSVWREEHRLHFMDLSREMNSRVKFMDLERRTTESSLWICLER